MRLFVVLLSSLFGLNSAEESVKTGTLLTLPVVGDIDWEHEDKTGTDGFKLTIKTPFGDPVFDVTEASDKSGYVGNLTFGNPDKPLLNAYLKLGAKQILTIDVPSLTPTQVLEMTYQVVNSKMQFELLATFDTTNIKLSTQSKLIHNQAVDKLYPEKTSMSLKGTFQNTPINAIMASKNLGTCLTYATGQAIKKYEIDESCQLAAQFTDTGDIWRVDFVVEQDREANRLTNSTAWELNDQTNRKYYAGVRKWSVELLKNSESVFTISGRWTDNINTDELELKGECVAEDQICSFYAVNIAHNIDYISSILPDQTIYIPSMYHLGGFVSDHVMPYFNPVMAFVPEIMNDQWKIVDIIYHIEFFYDEFLKASNQARAFDCSPVIKNSGLVFTFSDFNFQQTLQNFCSEELVNTIKKANVKPLTKVKKEIDSWNLDTSSFAKEIKLNVDAYSNFLKAQV